MDWTKTTARRDEKHFGFDIWCVLYKRFYGIFCLDVCWTIVWNNNPYRTAIHLISIALHTFLNNTTIYLKIYLLCIQNNVDASTWPSYSYLHRVNDLLSFCPVNSNKRKISWQPLLGQTTGALFCSHVNVTILQGLYSLSTQTSCRKISWSREIQVYAFSKRSEILQAPRQQRCRDACQISERYDYHNIQFRGFETWR